jgi:hypothetical protein
VEDHPADALLVEEAFKEHHVTAGFIVIGEGEKAIRFVEEIDASIGFYPKLVIIDLNFPKTEWKGCAAAHETECRVELCSGRDPYFLKHSNRPRGGRWTWDLRCATA